LKTPTVAKIQIKPPSGRKAADGVAYAKAKTPSAVENLDGGIFKSNHRRGVKPPTGLAYAKATNPVSG
jgi:hypothetical protein